MSAALKFNNRTELNLVTKNVVVRDYGDGVVEVGFSSVPTPESQHVDRRRYEPQAEFKQFTQTSSEVNLARSLRRSKATVRRKCMAGHLDHMLTLTYRENMTDVDLAYEQLTRFIRLVRQTHKDWKYVAVAEYQKRGACHFHLAVKGFQQVQVLRHLWRSVVGEGNIHVKAPRQRNMSKWTLPKLASYLSKYITKDTTVAFGRQRYRVAEGIEIPRNHAIVTFPVGVDQLQEIFDSLGAEIGYRFESEEGYGWACSW